MALTPAGSKIGALRVLYVEDDPMLRDMVATQLCADERIDTVEADGDAPANGRVAGNGTAIINAWLDDVGGRWSLEAGSDGGSRFSAVIGD